METNYQSGYDKIYYGAAFGVQKYGEYLTEPNLHDKYESTNEIFRRFRDSHGWLVLENGTIGISIASNQTSIDLQKGESGHVLLLSVYNAGDHAFISKNEGVLEYDFSIKTYKGSYEKNEMHRHYWEFLCPFDIQEVQTGIKQLENEHSFLSTGNAGVISAIKASSTVPDGFEVRIFNHTNHIEALSLTTSVPIKKLYEIDLLEQPLEGDLEHLKPYEIKNLICKFKSSR